MMTSHDTAEALPPGSIIGILGGGQLGRMLAIAAAELGFVCHIYAPAGDNPAFDVAKYSTAAPYEDHKALKTFAQHVDVVTYEFENIPDTCLTFLNQKLPVRPSVSVLSTTQDRIDEKEMAQSLGIDIPTFATIDSLSDLKQEITRIGFPAVLKTRRFGYDGKGQTVIKADSDLDQSFKEIGQQPAILEAFVPFEIEISVIAARDMTGNLEIFDIPENRHENHILRSSHVPAMVSDATRQKAGDIAALLGKAMDYIGIFAVELFVMRDNNEEKLMMNEIAPRVHNSGHWTGDACSVSQFEQHIRAITGLPLAQPIRYADVIMYNLLGDETSDIVDLSKKSGMCVHLYGKQSARVDRKMGHATQLSSPTPTKT